MLKIEPGDKPVITALLAIPFSIFLLFASLRVFPLDPPKIEQAKTEPNKDDGEKVSMIGWLARWTAEEYIALFSFFTLGAIAGQWLAMRRENEHFRVTERAYVRMSHVSNMRTGLQWRKEPHSSEADVLIEVKNCGRTPGRVTAVWLTCKVVPKGQEFPVNFSYADGDLSYDSGEGYSFVMPSDAIFVPQELDIHEAERRDVDEGSATLIVFGYVDYIDQFGARHRAGYGRQYIPNVAGNNLTFPAVRAKLNYDEPRAPGVGWDWPRAER